MVTERNPHEMHTLPPDLRAFGWNETKGRKQIEVRTKRCGGIDVAISDP
eukprot:SAG11_NODE_38143_length_253_cov_1.681818_1_plen_48_part_10